jgi:hypothetical protein
MYLASPMRQKFLKRPFREGSHFGTRGPSRKPLPRAAVYIRKRKRPVGLHSDFARRLTNPDRRYGMLCPGKEPTPYGTKESD